MPDAPQRRLPAGGSDAHQALAAHHQRAGPHRAAAGLLGHGLGLAGLQRLVQRHLVRLQHIAIGCHTVAFGQHEQVAAHHLAPGNAAELTTAHHQCARAGHLAQCVQRVVGAPLLHDGDAHDDEHKSQQRQGFVRVAHGQVNAAGGQQQQEHRFAGNFCSDTPQLAALGRAQFVGAFGQQTGRRSGRVQTRAGLRIGFKGPVGGGQSVVRHRAFHHPPAWHAKASASVV